MSRRLALLVLGGLLAWPGLAGPPAAVPAPGFTPIPYAEPSPSPSPSPPVPPPPPGYAFISQFDQPAHIPTAHLPWRVGSAYAAPVLQQALELWNDAGQGTLLQFEAELSRCDVVVDWSSQGLPPGKVSATWWDAGLGYKRVLGITVDPRGLPVGNQVQLVAHELGHALGLDHSQHPQDMMAEQMHRRRYHSLSGPELTDRDREALLWLYRQSDFVPIRGRQGLEGRPETLPSPGLSSED